LLGLAPLLVLSAPLFAQTIIPPPVPIGQAPGGIAFNPTRNHLYVPNQLDDTVSIIDTTSDTMVATVRLPASSEPKVVGVNPLTNRVYVGNKRPSLNENVTTIQDQVVSGATPTALPTATTTPTPAIPEHSLLWRFGSGLLALRWLGYRSRRRR